MLLNRESVQWEQTELSDIDLGDERLNERTIKILSALADNLQSSIPSATGSWNDTIAVVELTVINAKEIGNGQVDRRIDWYLVSNMEANPLDYTHF